MEIVNRALDRLEALLGHSPHQAIVALPLGAFGVSTISDVLAMVTGKKRFDTAAEVSMAVGLIGAAGAVVTGLRDYSYIPCDRQPNHRIATTHMIGNLAVSSLFASSYILRLASRARGESPNLLTRGLALCGGTLALYTGWLGGRLVAELGEGVKPVMKMVTELEENRSQSQAPAPGDHYRPISPEIETPTSSLGNRI